MSRFFHFLALLAPLALFIVAVLQVRELFDQGQGRLGIAVLLGALAVFAIWEGLMLKLWLLPAWGRRISERVYAGSYTPDQDALVSLAARIREERDLALMADMERLVMKDATRARSWMEWADLLSNVAHDRQAALQALLSGSEHVHGKEDRAMFLYKAARLCEREGADANRARDLYALAAKRYPNTVYGRKAASC